MYVDQQSRTDRMTISNEHALMYAVRGCLHSDNEVRPDQ